MPPCDPAIVIGSTPNAVSIAFLAKAGTELGSDQVTIGATFATHLMASVLGIAIFTFIPVERSFTSLTVVAMPVAAVARATTLGIVGFHQHSTVLFLVTVFVCRVFVGTAGGLVEAVAQVMVIKATDKENATSAVGRTELGRVAAFSIGPIVGGALCQLKIPSIVAMYAHVFRHRTVRVL